MDLMSAARRERSQLAELLATLSPDEWESPSLCRGWTVRDVVAHVLSYEGLPVSAVLRRLVRGRLTFAGMNRAALAEQRLTPEQLLQRLRDYPAPVGVTAARGGAVGLVDALIHQQDIRRPLGRPRTIDADALRFALPFAVTAPPLRGFWNGRGTRLVATDVGWSWGRGQEAAGPGEAVLMVLAGRAGAAADLEGPGAAVLRARHG